MSPDLNPIEHVWNHLKRQVEKRQPSNFHELKDVVATEWENIQPISCTKLAHSMQRRLAAANKNNVSYKILIHKKNGFLSHTVRRVFIIETLSFC